MLLNDWTWCDIGREVRAAGASVRINSELSVGETIGDLILTCPFTSDQSPRAIRTIDGFFGLLLCDLDLTLILCH